MSRLLVEKIIQENCSEDYSWYVNAHKDDIDILEHLSDAASTIMRWYPFKKDSTILQLNAGLGACTGALCDVAREVVSITSSEQDAKLLCKRYSKRTNLMVLSGKIAQLSNSKKFDYIIVFGELEWVGNGQKDNTSYIDYLQLLSTYLKKCGKIILQAENTYSVRNLCGRRDPFTNIAFDGISNYPGGTPARGFSRKQLLDIVKSAGFEFFKFYYPVYDHIVPRMIYSDECLPDYRILERYENYYHNPDTIVADDRYMLLDCIANGAFAFHANDFIVEASKIDNLCDIKFATVSSNRIREKAFSVCIYNDSTLVKKCMFPEAEEYAKQLCQDTVELRNRGIPILPMTYKNGIMEMEYVSSITLQEYICDLVIRGAPKKEIVLLFEKLWKYILSSSDYSDVCAFDTAGLDTGIILKKAYIDMIPLNCFYEDGEILFFDQEFAEKDYPANFVMMRALRNAYAFIDGLDSILSLKEARERFHLGEGLWNLYIEVDDKWLKQVNEPVQMMYYHKATSQHIRKNCFKLGGNTADLN